MFSKKKLDQFYRYSLSLTRNEEEAFDLLQSAYLKLLNRGNPERDPDSYFYSIIRNHFIDEFRKKSRMVYTDEPIEHQDDEEVTELAPNPESITISRQELEKVMEVLNSLERELIYLWAVEEMSISEIAELQEVSRGTLLSRLHRLKKKVQIQFVDTKEGV